MSQNSSLLVNTKRYTLFKLTCLQIFVFTQPWVLCSYNLKLWHLTEYTSVTWGQYPVQHLNSTVPVKFDFTLSFIKSSAPIVNVYKIVTVLPYFLPLEGMDSGWDFRHETRNSQIMVVNFCLVILKWKY